MNLLFHIFSRSPLFFLVDSDCSLLHLWTDANTHTIYDFFSALIHNTEWPDSCSSKRNSSLDLFPMFIRHYFFSLFVAFIERTTRKIGQWCKKTFSGEKNAFFPRRFSSWFQRKNQKSVLEKCLICTWKLNSIWFDFIHFDVCVNALDITWFVWYGTICMRKTNMHIQLHKWKRLRWKINTVHICKSNEAVCVCVRTKIRMFRHRNAQMQQNLTGMKRPKWAENPYATMYWMHEEKCTKAAASNEREKLAE